MIIDDRHLFRPGIRPPEDDAPLVVDTNGMETREPPAQSFKPVAGPHAQGRYHCGDREKTVGAIRSGGYKRENAAFSKQ